MLKLFYKNLGRTTAQLIRLNYQFKIEFKVDYIVISIVCTYSIVSAYETAPKGSNIVMREAPLTGQELIISIVIL